MFTLDDEATKGKAKAPVNQRCLKARNFFDVG